MILLSATFSLNRQSLVKALVLPCLIQAGGAEALEIGEGIQLHGFLSQAAAVTDHNNVGGKSSQGVALNLREVGGNVSWRADPDWLVSAQVLARWAGGADDGDVRLDYGFVDRTLSSGEGRFGVQLGKIKNPYGLYNTTRDVAHTRPGILMPQSIYWDRIRDFVLAAPGISIYGDTSRAAYGIGWRVNALTPAADSREAEFITFLQERPGHFNGKTSWLGQVMFEFDNDRWRLAVSAGELAMRYKPDGISDWQAGSTYFRPRALSLECNGEEWSFTAEYSETGVRRRSYGFTVPDNTAQAYYIQATWRIKPQWQAYARYDVLYADKTDKRGERFFLNTGLPKHLVFSEDITLGLRHDLDSSWAFAMEIHHVMGAAWLPRTDNPGVPSKDWNLLLLQAAYRF